MTMRTFRQRQRAEKLAYIEALIRETGSVRQAAKVAAVRRPHLIRLRKVLSQERDILNAQPEKATA